MWLQHIFNKLMKAKTNKAIIIGAGPSGLVTANELVKQGWSVEIYEALDRVGGMCRSFKWNDYCLDIGPHVFHTPNNKFFTSYLHSIIKCK